MAKDRTLQVLVANVVHADAPLSLTITPPRKGLDAGPADDTPLRDVQLALLSPLVDTPARPRRLRLHDVQVRRSGRVQQIVILDKDHAAVKARLIAVEAEWKSTRDELRQVQQRVLALEEAIGTTSTTPSVWSQIDDLVQAVFLLVAIAAGLGEAEACHAWNEYGSLAALRDAGLQDFLARPALQPGDGPPPPPKNPSALSAYQRPPVIHSLTEYHFFVSPNGYLDLSHLSPPSSATLFRAPSLLNKAAGAPPSAPPPPSVPALRYYGERSSRLGRAMLAAIAAEPVLTGVFSLERALRLDLETLQRPRSDLAHRRIKDRVTAGSILLGAIIRHSRTEDHAEVLQAAGALLSNGARFQGDAGRKVVPLVAADGR